MILKQFAHNEVKSINMFANNIGNRTITRLFVDDCDTCKYDEYEGQIKAKFYRYITATVKMHKVSRHNIMTIRNTYNTDIYNLFGILADNNYVNKNVNIPIIKIYNVLLKKKFSNLIDALAGINNDMLEMLQGDAVEEAATSLGLIANTVSELFEKSIKGRLWRIYGRH